MQFRVVNSVTIVDPQLGVPIRGFSIAASVQIGVVDCVAIVDPPHSPTQLSASLETSGVRSWGWGGGGGGGVGLLSISGDDVRTLVVHGTMGK